ncbi:hypothetical protein [Streptomyces qinglanensis]|uniref:Uncharacterized protein n=1 Tax=Streptomyces qinglanensis TaxID=943816 RepID=A0A1H9NNF6_9ACTN|nr:hypothetical protein [Streptomyces qinglanensis]SER37564.1 hypothetical protein SAMN05421870_101540 [Streptomyces qinglanensis]
MRPMLTGERRTGAPSMWCGHLLLLAALLLGLVSMHTLGHPAAGPQEAPQAAAPLSPSAVHDGSTEPVRAADGAVPPAHPAHPPRLRDGATNPAAGYGDSTPPEPEHGGGHGTGTDPLSVCPAVLGAWTAAALLGAAVTVLAPRGTDGREPCRSRIRRALRPLPPPDTSSRLARLSVLRI